MTDASIRLLTVGDLEEALELSSTAGWNQRIEDWRALLRIAPGGSFAARIGGRIVGTAIGIDYGRFGWIAMMLVDPAHRGRGLGARLLEAAMGTLPSSNPIRLDATPLGRPLYDRYGFQDEAMLTRHVAEAGSRAGRTTAAPLGDTIRPMTSDDLADVAGTDADVFGGNRRTVLEWALDNGPQYAYCVQSERGLHYCLGRRGRLFDQIGPVVAGAGDVASALVEAALGAAGGRAVVVDAFDGRAGFNGWLRDRGFQAQRPLFRMCRPAGQQGSVESRGLQERLVEFAILGPEFA